MRILVADSDINRKELVQYIQDLGHKVEEALSEREVLACCRKKCPDLIFINIKLSGASGLDVIKQIRKLGGVAVWNPIVLMVDHAVEEDLLIGIQSGADDFFIKPIDLLRVRYKINAAERHGDLKEEVFSLAHDLIMANRALESASSQDALTGIADVTTFHQELETEWFKAKKKEKKDILSVVLIDLDYFRAFNEIYGSVLGDQSMRKIALALKMSIEEKKISIARTTGAAFGVLLPGFGEKKSVKIAEKMKATILELKIPNSGSHCSDFLTASFGVSSTEDNAHFKNPLDLIESADYALYQAKHKGRNQVFFESAKVSED